jgi:hypothetical protein
MTISFSEYLFSIHTSLGETDPVAKFKAKFTDAIGWPTHAVSLDEVTGFITEYYHKVFNDRLVALFNDGFNPKLTNAEVRTHWEQIGAESGRIVATIADTISGARYAAGLAWADYEAWLSAIEAEERAKLDVIAPVSFETHSDYEYNIGDPAHERARSLEKASLGTPPEGELPVDPVTGFDVTAIEVADGIVSMPGLGVDFTSALKAISSAHEALAIAVDGSGVGDKVELTYLQASAAAQILGLLAGSLVQVGKAVAVPEVVTIGEDSLRMDDKINSSFARGGLVTGSAGNNLTPPTVEEVARVASRVDFTPVANLVGSYS